MEPDLSFLADCAAFEASVKAAIEKFEQTCQENFSKFQEANKEMKKALAKPAPG